MTSFSEDCLSHTSYPWTTIVTGLKTLVLGAKSRQAVRFVPGGTLWVTTCREDINLVPIFCNRQYPVWAVSVRKHLIAPTFVEIPNDKALTLP
jgi:hypothetical protein